MKVIPREKYTAVIGLEVHAQLLTASKFFASERAEYGQLPNTNVSVVSLAHPGTLPRINKKVIEHALRMGLACGASVTRRNLFARKNYFYPDLPKGYQITQDKTPICRQGKLTITLPDGSEKEVRLQRIHMEEDTGKSTHDLVPGQSVIDYNRAGVPLIEIVTEPDLRASEEAYALLTEIRKLVRYLGICNGNMEEGSLRCDANVSVMLKGTDTFGTRVEVKNINSIRNVQLAIEHEIGRHIALLEEGKKVSMETRSFDAATGGTRCQRSKETLSDYRYFPEPDLSPVILDEEWIEQVRSTLPLLPRQCVEKFTTVYGLSPYDAGVLTEQKEVALFYDALCEKTPHYKAAANWLMGPIKSYLNEHKVGIDQLPIDQATLVELIQLVVRGKVSFSAASQQLFPALIEQPTAAPETLAGELSLLQETDAGQLHAWVDEVLVENPDKVAAYRGGKHGLLGFFMGEVMKKSRGKADPKATSAYLQQQLSQ